MTRRIDPFTALDPYAVLLLRHAVGQQDIARIALPRHQNLARALNRLLHSAAPQSADAVETRARLLAMAPDLAPHVTLVEHCANRLVDVVCGRAEGSEVMFPGGSMSLVEPIYQGSRWTDHFNNLTASAVGRAVSACLSQNGNGMVRILEVGAGTGGTSGAVLAALESYRDNVTYDYTDVSPGFIQHGKRIHGAGRPFLTARILDLERPPVSQGFEANSYDVVLGTNVLHATSRIAASLEHISSVLRIGGLLLLNEITRAGAFASMTFGLLDGWWGFRDPEVRLPDGPVLSAAGWRQMLTDAGFNVPATFGWTDPLDESFQCLFVSAKIAEVSARAMPARDLRHILAEHLAGLLGLACSELAADRPLADYGVDSIVAPQFVTVLNRHLGSRLVPSDVFNYATLAGLAQHLGTMRLVSQAEPPPNPTEGSAPTPEPMANNGPPPTAPSSQDIAVIGLSCRFPGARDADEFWQNLVAGKSSITEVPADRWPTTGTGPTRWGGFLEDHDCFDPEFFNLSWREAEAMSPQQRVFLEQAWNALENAGYGKRGLGGQRCGVYVGAAPDGYGVNQNDSLSSLGGSLAILSARISYLLDLKGPSLPLDTACSSSLVAVHLACQSLLSGDCDMALAGGVSILMTDHRLHSFLDDAGMLSPTGQCHTFDSKADGFVPGEGVGIVVLKRLDQALADRDEIIGVIKASGINQDGRTSGITAPSGPAQTALEEMVYRRAGVSPAAIGLVEAHGTGTQLGDPIEVNALANTFRLQTDRSGYCALGSVKTNIGHTLTAAGVAGLIKVLQALRHGTIPPSLNFANENPEINFGNTPFFVPHQAIPWQGTPRLAAVSSFGFSGTNAHVVVANAPLRDRHNTATPLTPTLILLSARSPDALHARRQDLMHWLRGNEPDLGNLAYTLSHGRGHFEHRLALIVDSVDALREWRGTVRQSEPLILPARGNEDAEMATLLDAATPDLNRIADCYLRGGDGDWSRIAAPGARRLAMPGYRFLRQRFQTRPILPAQAATSLPMRHALPHPLLSDNVSRFGEIAFALNLDVNAPWCRDHRLNDRSILPASAIMELAREATSVAANAPVTAIKNLRFHRPIMAGSAGSFRITLQPQGRGATFTVLSSDDTVHADGIAETGDIGIAPTRVDVQALKSRLRNHFTREEIYPRFRKLGFDYGAGFQVITALHADHAEVLAELASRSPVEDGVWLDPALLDGAIQSAIGLILVKDEALTSVTPVSMGQLTIHGPIRGTCLAHVTLQSVDNDIRRLKITVLDGDGRAIVTLDDVAIRAVAAEVRNDVILTYTPKWEPQPVPNAAPPSSIVLFDRDETLWRMLGQDTILVRPGSAFCRLEQRSFAIDPANPADYARLLSTLRSEDFPAQTIWHLWSRQSVAIDLRAERRETLDAALRDGLQSVFLLSAALTQQPARAAITLLHVHPAGSTATSLYAPIAAFGAALRRENPTLRVASIGVATTDLPRLMAILSAETGNGQDDLIDEVHWDATDTRTVRKFRICPPETFSTVPLRQQGVTLLTGALGGIGRHVARHLAARHKARLILVGRSPSGTASDALIAEIRTAGGDAVYLAADITQDAAVKAAVALAKSRFGGLHGVIHAAGVTRDRFLLHKTAEDFELVLAPKLLGTLALDRATVGEDLDFFVCFSSLAGTFGNAGQTDYSAANRFLDAYMQARTGPGRSLSIGWPYWREGGLIVDEAEQRRRSTTTGVRSLETDEALAVFDTLVGGATGTVLVLPGDPNAIDALLHPGARVPKPAMPPKPNTTTIDSAVNYLRTLLADATSMPEDRINPDRPLEQYGIDSILVTKMNAVLEQRFPGLPKTLFFEHQTLREAAGYLAFRHGDAFEPQAVEDREPAAPRPALPTGDGIAIIGIAGRYPGADTLEAFWDNLCSNRDLITEIPKDRWDQAAWFDAKPGVPGRSYSKWGGFLTGVDQFDPLFFNIAPAEAAGIDPNERLFLEVCWEALENAGHTRATLTSDPARSVGVYAGVMYGEYQILAAAAQNHANGSVGGASPYWSVANRVSYHMDLHGPSMTVDTACSSSLTAIHLACQALSTGECSVAIAGGVNLSLHPLKYVGLSQGRFAASDGHCHSFAAGGDGYVPGEGVGVVILKPLSAAIADGDYIHAVIRGWATNHGGKTNGYTVPNPRLQGDVIAASLRRASVDPATVSYIEAHGTGTALGDPIEIAGLSAAFGASLPPQSCALGSVKANIGHLEAAAGIAGLTRVVLQLQHRTLTPTRRHGPDNPNIDFSATPFRLQERTQPWVAAEPLRAGVSSFGAGGANAHLVVEEFRPTRAAASAAGSSLLVLSARTESQLRAYAERLIPFLRNSPFCLADICRTLQFGREPMSVRLAVVVDTLEAAVDRLTEFLRQTPNAVHFGVLDDMAAVAPLSASSDLEAMARAWASGASVDWKASNPPGERVPVLPHPFMRRRYWLDMTSPPPSARAEATLHPFLDRSEPSLDGAVLVKRFLPTDPIVRDHLVQGRLMVPGVVQLEMARSAMLVAGVSTDVLTDVVWSGPLLVHEEGTDARITLTRDDQGVGFEITVPGTGPTCRGRARQHDPVAPETIDLVHLRMKATRHLGTSEIYERLESLGLNYGPSLRSLTDLWVTDSTIMAALNPINEPADIVLSPSVMDGALQSLVGFAEGNAGQLFVPFSLSEIRQFGHLRLARFVVGTRRGFSNEVALFDLNICDADGKILLTLTQLAARPGCQRQPSEAVPLTIREPFWEAAPQVSTPPTNASVLVVHAAEDQALAERFAANPGVRTMRQTDDSVAIANAMSDATDVVWIASPPRDGDMAQQSEEMAYTLLRVFQELDRSARLGRDLHLRIVTRNFQSVSLRERPDPRAAALIGVAKCIALEFPRVAVSLIDLDALTCDNPRVPHLVLAEPARVPTQEVAWRVSTRWVQRMRPVHLPNAVTPLRPGSIVLIVGGAGGIGCEIAAWLARDCSARIALVGRRPETALTIPINSIPSGTGEIRYFQADATDPAAMAEVVACVRETWGGIDAAVHAALVLRDRTIALMDRATFHAVLASKIAGSLVLAEALAGENLQFFAFLSSVNVISGSRGQANYVAGSSFVDAFARHLAAERPWRVVVTNWGLWGDVGVVSDQTYRSRLAALGVHPISPADGIAALASVLSSNLDRVAIARAEPEALHQLGLTEQYSADQGETLEQAETAFAALERYGRVCLREALVGMTDGAADKAWTPEGLRRRLGIASRHTKLFTALLDTLSRDGLVTSADGLWRFGPTRPDQVSAVRDLLDIAQRGANWLAGPRRLLQACLDSYPSMLQGAVDPVSVLFPRASTDLVEAAYTGNPIADRCNIAVANAVKDFVASRAESGPIRVIEIGAGTGSTTAAILNMFGSLPRTVEYVVTDVSQHFLTHGKARFAGWPGLEFAMYDAERNPRDNGLIEGSFDLIVASNVLHATSDLPATLARARRLLRSNGRLLLSEATRAQDFGTMVFGLTQGWWLATDPARRIPFSPLVAVDGWRTALTDAGFADTDILTAVTPGIVPPHAVFSARNTETFAPQSATERLLIVPPPRVAAGPTNERLQDYLRGILADVLKLDPDEVRVTESFDRYGMESLTALEIRNRMDRDIPGLPATLLFEHNTIARLAAWLTETHQGALARLFSDAAPIDPPLSAATAIDADPRPRRTGTDEPIAIIGFSGRYPGGANPEEFWRLLSAGESAITEVPASRWPAAATFDADGAEGRSYTKWAGFIDDVDCFDPLFFNISPLEAEVMDPQERLFLETAWATLEQAGYTPRRLRDRAGEICPNGGDVGVFVGAMNVPYQWLAAEAWAAGHPNAASTNYWSIANRVSFLLDFSGPSMVVDTACSASLTAIHLACESLRRGECGAALAGGVNLILHPRQFVNLSQARMVSHGAECRAFGSGADGFVDGEGVGAVLLKPLSVAERDGDRIEGVILGSAVNTGGRTSGFTVPNPSAQARVIRAALGRAGVSPSEITYIEAHGTGTALGDPIEIAGLSEVFATTNRAPCAIGAVKANIGHLESAAGIAGLTKVLLQLRHRTILPNRHAATPNPLIDLSRTPFVFPAEQMRWEAATPGGQLTAGLSSFGAGGANAHLVIQSYEQPDRALPATTDDELIILSARDPDQLRLVATNLLAMLRRHAIPLVDLAHTMRVGRDAMGTRLAILSRGQADLDQKLTDWLGGLTGDHVMYGTVSGSATRALSETESGRNEIASLVLRVDLLRLAELWVQGAEIDWTALPTDRGGRLAALPTYPFRRERYWLPTSVQTTAAPPTTEPSITTAEPEITDQPARIQLFSRTWQPAPALARRQAGTVLVLSRNPSLATALASIWSGNVISVRVGNSFVGLDARSLQLDPTSEDDHAALIAYLARTEPGGFDIVQALDWQAAGDPPGGDGPLASILLTQAAQRGEATNARILHVFTQADDRPLDQAVGSLARSAVQESDNCRLRAVGILDAAGADRVATICRDELLAADDAPEVLHGPNGRQSPGIDPVAIDAKAATIGFRIGGAYLLVGGLGEVGCAIAERLGRDYRARVAIIGRSEPRGPALERLRKLRESGLQVHYEACNLTDRAGLHRALASIRAQFGRLHGVLHLARTVEDALLVRKSAASVGRVMAAKVDGSIALDAALAGEELDWFVLCSSLAAWLGLAGGGDYALACAFQSGFARLRQQKVERGERYGRTVAICWPQWRHDKYLNDAKLRRLATEGLQTIDARDGLRIIEQAMQADRTEVAAVKGTERAFHRLTLAYRQDIAPTIGVPAQSAHPDDEFAAELSQLTDTELAAYLQHLTPVEPSEDTEQVVLDTICAFLKLPAGRFGADSEFAEFGLDSIKALHVSERLQKRLGVQIDPAMFYEYPQISAFAKAVAGRSAMPFRRIRS